MSHYSVSYTSQVSNQSDLSSLHAGTPLYVSASKDSSILRFKVHCGCAHMHQHMHMCRQTRRWHKYSLYSVRQFPRGPGTRTSVRSDGRLVCIQSDQISEGGCFRSPGGRHASIPPAQGDCGQQSLKSAKISFAARDPLIQLRL